MKKKASFYINGTYAGECSDIKITNSDIETITIKHGGVIRCKGKSKETKLKMEILKVGK